MHRLEDGTLIKEIDDLIPLKKLENLQSLNLCSTYYPIEFKVELPSENNQSINITGNAQIELFVMGIKSNILILHLGQYAYDELLIFVAEMCK
jgi:hypothetical protein